LLLAPVALLLLEIALIPPSCPKAGKLLVLASLKTPMF
jgi:hypothetical protein